MQKSILFIADISGFTQFVKTTEVEHSQHVIAELLEVLITACGNEMVLAEVEGDALFFYKEGKVLSQEKLLALIETVYTAFYSHLKLIEKNRICPCMACGSVCSLELKIIVHIGEIQFINIQKSRKPFGESVIEAHRLLKNSIDNNNYCLLTNDLMSEIKMPSNYSSMSYQFKSGSDSYDGKNIDYQYSLIDREQLQLKSYQEEYIVSTPEVPNAVVLKNFNVAEDVLLESITNYKNKHHWAVGVDEIIYNEHEVTRYGSEHMCVIDGKHLDIRVVAKRNKQGTLDYGEITKGIAGINEILFFFNIQSISKEESTLQVEIYWDAKTIIDKWLINLVGKKKILSNLSTSLDNLGKYMLAQSP